eukprot:TRINITY_DN27007_c0_g1_i2.p1 TRINITY_DN27007_c0_g1~~TRINITY_DN27007_c0_g1_i2.p1  ORF type:complete len:277 (+),score=78.78 TRINITY_DN27007_c0_g1_i2:167-997(+)
MRRSRHKQDLAAALLDAQASLTDGEGSSSSKLALEDGAMPPPAAPKGKKRGRDGKSKAADTQAQIVAADDETASRYTKRDPSEDDIQAIARDIASQHGIEAIMEGRIDPAAAQRVEELTAGKPDFGAPPGSSKSSQDAVGESPSKASEKSDGKGGVESLSDIEDEELECYLLDAEEQQHKSDIWHEVNKDYLEEWHVRGEEIKRKRMEGKASASQGGSSEVPPDSGSENVSGSGRRSGRRMPPAGSCTQSAMMALAKKGKVGSNRINIDALESLFS